MPEKTNPMDGLEFIFDDGPTDDILDDVINPALPVISPDKLDIFETNPNEDEDEEEEEEEDELPKKKPASVEVEEEEDDDDDEDEEESPEKQLAGLASYFGKIGLLNFGTEDPLKIKWTEDEFVNKFQDAKKQGALEEIERLATERFGDFGPDFVQKVLVDGVPYQSYFGSFNRSQSIENLDPDDEKHAEKIVSSYLSSRGFDDEEIETQVSYLIENRLISKKAEKFKGILLEDEKEERDSAAAKAKQNAEFIRDREAQRITTYSDTIKEATKNGDLLGVPISQGDSKGLLQFVTDKPHVLQNGQKVTDFEYKLAKIRHEEPQKFLAIAKILMDNVDLSKIVTGKVTKETNTLFNEIKLGTKKKVKQGNSNDMSFLFK